ncbi:MAG: indolepyruvate oxidoreductase subunit beta [Coriobacteriia bacterium]
MRRNLIFAGVGGQGTVLASKLVARSALAKGLKVRSAETIGMAQRGGSVVSHIRIGEGAFSPLLPLGSADVILGFEPAEAVRSLGYLREGGCVVVSARAIPPVTASLSGSRYNGSEMLEYLRARAGRVIVVDGEAVCAECGSPKVLNTALLGAAAASGTLGIALEELETAVRESVPERLVDVNVCALRVGAAYA